MVKKSSSAIIIAVCTTFLFCSTVLFYSSTNTADATTAFQINSFTATPTAVQSGQAVILGWTLSSSGVCSITAPGVNSIFNIISNNFVVFPTQPTQYTLTCKPGAAYPGVTRIVSVSIVEAPPKITAFTATPTHINLGGSTLLKWSTSGPVTKCFNIQNNLSTNSLFVPTGTQLAPNNSIGVQISPTISSTYVLLCGKDTLTPNSSYISNTNPADLAALTITVIPPPAPQITSFTATPPSVPASGFTKLTWTTTNTQTCSLQGTSAVIQNTDGIYVGPISTNTSYTLSCQNTAGMLTTRTVSVITTATPPTTCKYIDLTLNESKPTTPTNSPVSFILTDKVATGEEVGSSVLPYSIDWNPDYVLKTLRANGTVIGSYNLFSGRFVNLENFTTPSQSQIIENAQATLDAVVPYDPTITAIQIDTRPAISLSASAMTCPQICKLTGQSVSFPTERCCTGLSAKNINNTFVCGI